MKAFFQRLFSDHVHKWVDYKSCSVKESANAAPYAYIIIMRCTVCGELKNHKVSA